MHKCRESRESLIETPATDEDSALLVPSSFKEGHETRFDSGQTGQERGVCVCVDKAS